MSSLIGLGGYVYSGKDAFADVLENRLGWYKTYMSKALRESLEVLNPWVAFDTKGRLIRFAELVKELGYEKAKEFPEVRALLQRMGTEVGRKLWNEDFWVDLCFDDAIKHLERGKPTVVTGIRYPNELKVIQNLGGTSVWVSRPGYSAVNAHSSDNSLVEEDFDFIFKNDGTLEDLDDKVPEFLRTLGYWNSSVSYKDVT